MRLLFFLSIIILISLPFFVFAQSIELEVNVQAVDDEEQPGGGGATLISYASVIIKGWAHPDSSVTILQDGRVATTIQANSSANFTATIGNLTPGIWTFSIWAEDTSGRRSITFSFTTSLIGGITTTISNIFLPPTIELDKETVIQGEQIKILGQTVPESEVSIHINSEDEPIIIKVQADEAGAYFFDFNTASLELGVHNAKSKAASLSGLVSDFSNSYAFIVETAGKILDKEPKIPGECVAANLNCDFDQKSKDIVNIVDVSILLYNWGIPRNMKADLNNDGTVDLTDFSILLFYWTG
ncbi:hypothetical protein IID20_01970 [Patescibacteria group bacterium]|nr:hypothetical protein [Patescibacteria group bacterium]